jgi:hypothetical protein
MKAHVIAIKTKVHCLDAEIKTKRKMYNGFFCITLFLKDSSNDGPSINKKSFAFSDLK